MASQIPSPTPALPTVPSQSQFQSAHSRPTSPSSNSTISFHSAPPSPSLPSQPPNNDALPIIPSLTSSHALKTSGNTLFSTSNFSQALSIYERALAACPRSDRYAVAVLRSNMAECHIRMQEWKEAVERATEALRGLEELTPKLREETGEGTSLEEEEGTGKKRGEDAIGGEREAEDEEVKAEVEELDEKAVRMLHFKTLHRRARASRSENTWSTLSAAQDDYKRLLTLCSPSSSPLPFSTPLSIPPATQKSILSALHSLPSEIETAQKGEMAEMLTKLRQVGDGVLKPFGLSTNDFKMERNEQGGYGLSMDRGGGGK